MPAVAASEIAAIPGPPECALGEAVRARLPATAPDAPWDLRLEAVVWWHRATPAAAAMLPPALRRRRLIPLTVAALVRYRDTPVGPYSEVLASPVLLVRRGLPLAHIAFIVVDSLASVAGGRANWALPKGLGRFAWQPQDLQGDRIRAVAAGEAAGSAWSVAADARPIGPRVPIVARARVAQATPPGAVLEVPSRLRGRARPALVGVRTAGPSLPRWLLAGRRAGAVLDGVTARCGDPR